MNNQCLKAFNRELRNVVKTTVIPITGWIKPKRPSIIKFAANSTICTYTGLADNFERNCSHLITFSSLTKDQYRDEGRVISYFLSSDRYRCVNLDSSHNTDVLHFIEHWKYIVRQYQIKLIENSTITRKCCHKIAICCSHNQVHFRLLHYLWQPLREI